MAPFSIWEQAMTPKKSTPRKRQMKQAVKPKGKPPRQPKGPKAYKGGAKMSKYRA